MWGALSFPQWDKHLSPLRTRSWYSRPFSHPCRAFLCPLSAPSYGPFLGDLQHSLAFDEIWLSLRSKVPGMDGEEEEENNVEKITLDPGIVETEEEAEWRICGQRLTGNTST